MRERGGWGREGVSYLCLTPSQLVRLSQGGEGREEGGWEERRILDGSDQNARGIKEIYSSLCNESLEAGNAWITDDFLYTVNIFDTQHYL